MPRPSHKELNTKIKQGKALIAADLLDIVNPVSFAADAIDLNYAIEDLRGILSSLLDEIRPAHYVGHRPPQRSYERKITGTELFAFQWESTLLQCEVYLKFALYDDRLWLVSLHKSKKKRG